MTLWIFCGRLSRPPRSKAETEEKRYVDSVEQGWLREKHAGDFAGMCVGWCSCWASWFRDRPRQKGAQKTATKSRMGQSTRETISTHLFLQRVSKDRYLFRENKDTHRPIQAGKAEPGAHFICVGRQTAVFFYIVRCTHLKLTYVKTVPSLYIVGWSSFEIS